MNIKIASLIALIMFFIIPVNTFAQTTPPPTPTVTNCFVSIINTGKTATISQSAALTNVKSVTVVTRAYLDDQLVFNETNYATFDKLFTGAYNYKFVVSKTLDSDKIVITNTFYIKNGGQSTYISNCNRGANF